MRKLVILSLQIALPLLSTFYTVAAEKYTNENNVVMGIYDPNCRVYVPDLSYEGKKIRFPTLSTALASRGYTAIRVKGEKESFADGEMYLEYSINPEETSYGSKTCEVSLELQIQTSGGLGDIAGGGSLYNTDCSNALNSAALTTLYIPPCETDKKRAEKRFLIHTHNVRIYIK